MKRLVPLDAGVAIGAVLLGYGVVWASFRHGHRATVAPTPSPRANATSTAFQMIESAILAGLALLILGFAVYWVTRRAT